MSYSCNVASSQDKKICSSSWGIEEISSIAAWTNGEQATADHSGGGKLYTMLRIQSKPCVVITRVSEIELHNIAYHDPQNGMWTHPGYKPPWSDLQWKDSTPYAIGASRR